VTGLVDSSSAQCALIEARRTEGRSERLVISYPDEESLRELVAGPSIIACRLASREEAQTNIDAEFCTAAAWKKTSGDRAEKYQRGLFSAERRLGARFNLTQTARIVRGVPPAAVAGVILIFHSRNAVSTVIRSFIGG
jgi:hypothetical protein